MTPIAGLRLAGSRIARALLRDADLHRARVDGTPLLCNQADLYMLDLLICRNDHADRVIARLAECAGKQAA